MPTLIHYAIPAFIFLILLEAFISAKEQLHLYEIKDTAASLSMGVGNVLVGLLTKGFFLGLYFMVYEFRLFDLGHAWWVWILLVFADDFTYYWLHRLSHESRILWASHVVHHSSQKYNLGTALRQTWTGSFFSGWFYIWLPLLGFHPLMVLTMNAISLIYQFWIHTEVIHKMGPLEWILNTPSHHRVHHASDAQYLDRNHAGMLIIWDRIFGTFVPEKERPTYGLTKNIYTYNPVRIALHEWQDLLTDVWNAPGWRAKIGYLFGPPGWKHDGTGITSEELRKRSKLK
ncbi:MAG TPA: sterol desaturase family protein [Rhodothermales bacterium]|nr:sterol desaturase family protein [Rhodothermales bacterium]